MADILAAAAAIIAKDEIARATRREAKKAYKKANPEKVKADRRRHYEKHYDELLIKRRERVQQKMQDPVEVEKIKMAAKAANEKPECKAKRAVYNRLYYQRKKDENEQAKAIIAASKVAPPNF